MIKIISFVDSYKHYDLAIKEFEKRLGKNISFTKLKPSKKKNILEIISDETNILLNNLEKLKGYKVLLYIDGKTMNSLEFSKFLEEKQAKFSDIIFIIGGAYGVDYEKIKNLIDFNFSFGPMTFPHIQAIMMIFEQIYRGISIQNNSSYHH